MLQKAGLSRLEANKALGTGPLAAKTLIYSTYFAMRFLLISKLLTPLRAALHSSKPAGYLLNRESPPARDRNRASARPDEA